MDATVADDKIHAVVNLVLHAVDQRLAPVREQLAELTNAMHRSHAELGGRIDACQRLVAALEASGPAPSALQSGDEPTAQATAHLIEAANVLTDQVAFLEARVNSYTNNRIAEVKMLIDRASWAPESEPTSSKSTLMASAVASSPTNPAAIAAALIASAPGITAPAHGPVAALASLAASTPRHLPADDLDNVAPAAARLSPLSRAGNVSAAPTSSTIPSVTAPVHATLAPPPSAASTSPEPETQMSDDIARLSAQMSARLAAAVDRALGVSPAT